MHCARCNTYIRQGETTGYSGLYNHGDGIQYLLCEPCFFAEEAEVDEKGTNDIPERRAQYEVNQPGGSYE